MWIQRRLKSCRSIFSFIWWFSLLFLTCAPVNYRLPIVSFPINSQPEWLKSMSRLPMVASPHASSVLGPSNLLCGKVWRPPSALAAKARGRSTPPPSCCASPSSKQNRRQISPGASCVGATAEPAGSARRHAFGLGVWRGGGRDRPGAIL